MSERRVDDLARLAGATVRNVRAYQDRGLLPPPRKQGRVALYGDAHLARLKQIQELLARGYSLANIEELLAAQAAGSGLGAVLGAVEPLAAPPAGLVLSREAYAARYGPDALGAELALVAAFGLVEETPEGLRLPFPAELDAGYELRALGVPMDAVGATLAALRADMAQVAARVLDLAARHVLAPLAAAPGPAADLEALVDRLPAIAHTVVRDELDRAMRAQVRQRVADLIVPS